MCVVLRPFSSRLKPFRRTPFQIIRTDKLASRSSSYNCRVFLEFSEHNVPFDTLLSLTRSASSDAPLEI